MYSKARIIKTPQEIEILAEGGKILHDILQKLSGLIEPGISTAELNDFAEQELKKAGAQASFKGYGPKDNPFPAALCTSINNVVVHGIPSKDIILKNGDIIGLDFGVKYKNFYTDAATTVGVGKISNKAEELIHITKNCLTLAVAKAEIGNRIGDISAAIQETAEAAGFSVVRDLVGHGVGYEVHEDPSVPCFGRPGSGRILQEGMVLAIEPMVCEGDYFLNFEPDGWTISTKDKKLAAHFEHTVAITKSGPQILA